MRRMIIYLSALTALAASVTATPKQSADGIRDKRACSVATLKGNYAFTFNGLRKTTGKVLPSLVRDWAC